MYVLTIAILLLTLTFHELGHYTFARIFKVNVKEFAIGVGPKLKS
jgi:membrane-associated protease RseP (regulator of RpoE activity)